MKKLAVLAVAMLAVSGVAFGSALNVPFFNDTSNPAQGYIGIVNTSTTAVEISVFYRAGTGADRTPTANTYSLGSNGNAAWRPGTIDPTNEGVNSAVPDMTGARPSGTGSTAFTAPLVGSCQIRWPGSPDVIVGRYVEIAPNVSSFSYLLPAAM